MPVPGSVHEPPSQAVPGGKSATADVPSLLPLSSVPSDSSDPCHCVPSRDDLNLSKGKGWALDLFCGTGAVGRRLTQLGYRVVTLDINPRTKPTVLCDILEWKFDRQFPRGYFDVIAASVPCTQYSQARTTRERDFGHADAVVKKVLKIVHYFNPRVWWIENPRTGHLKDRPFMKDIPYCDVDYCQFSDWGYKKPTRIWGNEKIAQLPSKLCDPKNVQTWCLGLTVREAIGKCWGVTE